jgi:hypothetical protein
VAQGAKNEGRKKAKGNDMKIKAIAGTEGFGISIGAKAGSTLTPPAQVTEILQGDGPGDWITVKGIPEGKTEPETIASVNPAHVIFIYWDN